MLNKEKQIKILDLLADQNRIFLCRINSILLIKTKILIIKTVSKHIRTVIKTSKLCLETDLKVKTNN